MVQDLEDSSSDNVNPDGGIVYAYQVSDPERYGVVDFDDHMNVLSIEEKPVAPKSNFASTRLIFLRQRVISIAKNPATLPKRRVRNY